MKLWQVGKESKENVPKAERRTLLPTLRFVLLFTFSVPLALLIVSLWPEAWRFALLYPVAALALFAVDLSMALPQNRLYAVTHAPRRLSPGKRGVGKRGEGREECVELSLDAGGETRPVRVEALLELTGNALSPRPVQG